MSIIDNIRKKPQAEKVKIIWAMVITVALLMIALWVISSKYSKRVDKDTTLFQTIGRGFRDIKNNYKK